MGSRVVQEVTVLLACGFKQAPHVGEAPGIGPGAEVARGDLDPRLDPCAGPVLLGCWRGHTWTRGSAMRRRGRSPSVPTGPDCNPTTDEGCMFAEGMPDRFPRRRRTAVDAVPAKLSAPSSAISSHSTAFSVSSDVACPRNGPTSTPEARGDRQGTEWLWRDHIQQQGE